MSEAKQMDEKYFDMQYRLIDQKLVSITNQLESFGKDVKKILDDHEQRLRDTVKSDTDRREQIVTLQMEQKDLKNEIETLKKEALKRIEDIQRIQTEKLSREVSLWQTIGVEALKYVAFGASSGGVVVAILKLAGVLV